MGWGVVWMGVFFVWWCGGGGGGGGGGVGGGGGGGGRMLRSVTDAEFIVSLARLLHWEDIWSNCHMVFVAQSAVGLLTKWM